MQLNKNQKGAKLERRENSWQQVMRVIKAAIATSCTFLFSSKERIITKEELTSASAFYPKAGGLHTIDILIQFRLIEDCWDI